MAILLDGESGADPATKKKTHEVGCLKIFGWLILMSLLLICGFKSRPGFRHGRSPQPRIVNKYLLFLTSANLSSNVTFRLQPISSQVDNRGNANKQLSVCGLLIACIENWVF